MPAMSIGNVSEAREWVRIVLPSSTVTATFGNRCRVASWALGRLPTSKFSSGLKLFTRPPIIGATDQRVFSAGRGSEYDTETTSVPILSQFVLTNGDGFHAPISPLARRM